MTHTFTDASDIYPPTILCHYLLKNSIYVFEGGGEKSGKNRPGSREMKGVFLSLSFLYLCAFWRSHHFQAVGQPGGCLMTCTK